MDAPEQENIGRRTQNLRQTMGAGMQAIMGQKGRTYHVLRHMSDTPWHKIGSEEKILIDHIELGRDRKCQICFDESQKTVSRRHAAIVKENDQWFIVNLSDKNPTLVNGRPVKRKWYLNAGDEIQLSMEGPRIAFTMPADPRVAALPIGERVVLAGQQALRPYKMAIATLGALFVVGVIISVTIMKKMSTENLALNNKVVSQQDTIGHFKDSVAQVSQSLQTSEAELKKLKTERKRLLKQIRTLTSVPRPALVASGVSQNSPSLSVQLSADLKQFHSGVYFIKAKRLIVEIDGEKEVINDYPLSGTGFMLEDGKLITSRHIIEPWMFFDEKKPDPADLVLNKIANNNGKVRIQFEATAPGKDAITFYSDQMVANRKGDAVLSMKDTSVTKSVSIVKKADDISSDWAYLKTDYNGPIKANYGISKNLPGGAEVFVLGYPFAMGTKSKKMEPLTASCKIASGTLQNGLIIVNNNCISSGNSGGPVFYSEKGQLVAVGIVSFITGANTLGGVIPISNIND